VRQGKKIAVSLIAATLFLAAFAVAGYAGFFSLIETRFYRNSRIKFIQQRLLRISGDFESALSENSARFKQFAVSQGIIDSFDIIQLEDDIKNRNDGSTALLAETPGLRGIRLVTGDGRRIHYSTFTGDLFQSDIDSISYTNYYNLDELPYEEVAASPNADYRIVFDAARGKLIFAFPVFDRIASHRGTLLFYVDAADFSEQLVLKDSIALADRPVLTGNSIVFALPSDGFAGQRSARDLLIDEIGKRLTPERIGSETLLDIGGTVWVLFSTTLGNDVSIAWVENEEFFILPPLMRLILLACVFITAFLTLFLLLNIKHDDEAIIRDRIRKFQLAFFREYFDKREEINWQKVSSDIMYRKAELNNAIKKSLRSSGKKHRELIDALLEKSWDEIFAVIGNKAVAHSQGNEIHEEAEAVDDFEEITDAEELEEFESPDKIESSEKIDFPIEIPVIAQERFFDEISIDIPANAEFTEDEPIGLIELCGAEFDTSFFINPDLFFPTVEMLEICDEITDIIVEHDGLYTISKQAPLAAMEQDSEFKTLVESVIQ
jgi:hypothetical protein